MPVIFNFLKRFFLKKSEQTTLDLPVIKEQYFTFEHIADYLHGGVSIIAVFDPNQKFQVDGRWSFNALLAAEMNGLQPSISLYRKEGSFLCNYKAFKFENDPLYHFMLYKVYEMKNSNIMELINSDFREAFELYIDTKNWAEKQLYFLHDFTENEGQEFFKMHPNERFLFLGKERLVKKEKAEMKEEEIG